MSYKSPLETRLAKKVTKAISEYALIEDGDRVMVGLSGGKDSWALLNILDVLRKRAPISFSLVAVTVDSGYQGYRHDLIASTCEQRGWEYRVEHTEIGAVMDDLLDGATPCSLCARLRRGVLYRLATEVSATKIAARAYAKDEALPIITCCCPACGDLSLQRQRVKRLIAQLEVEHPEVKNSMIRALGNVASRHLLDRRLNPLPELRDAALASGAVPLVLKK